MSFLTKANDHGRLLRVGPFEIAGRQVNATAMHHWPPINHARRHHIGMRAQEASFLFMPGSEQLGEGCEDMLGLRDQFLRGGSGCLAERVIASLAHLDADRAGLVESAAALIRGSGD